MDSQPETSTENSAPNSQTSSEPIRPETKEVVREVHHHHYETKRGPNFGRFMAGGLLIIVGLVYLASSLGWIEFNVEIWQLWPLLIIFVGLSLLARHGWVSWLVGVLITLLILGGIAWVVFGQAGLTQSLTSEPIAIERSSEAQSAVIDISTGAGTLKISGGADQLVTGKLESNFAKLSQSSSVSDSAQRISLSAKGSWSGFGVKRINNLDLKLDSNTPILLNVDSGASDMELDLSQIEAQSVTIDTGASKLDLTLGDQVAQSRVTVKAGVSSVDISLPKTVGAKLTIDAGLSSKNLSDFNQKDNQTYESASYASADKKIDIDLDLGVSSLDVTWR